MKTDKTLTEWDKESLDIHANVTKFAEFISKVPLPLVSQYFNEIEWVKDQLDELHEDAIGNAEALIENANLP